MTNGDASADGPQGPSSSARRSVTRRSAEEPAAEQKGYSAEVSQQVAEAVTTLAGRLADPSVAHSVEEIERVMRGFSTTVEGMAEGLDGLTEWLRAAGHAGALSGHASVVSERMVHLGRELTRLAEAVQQAQRGESA